ncbi:MAG: hypothetical protein L0Y71_16765 [Gemmataceae bacterium]|nr:hypothetical protein [Gemmataceae bacterium]
MSEQEIKEIVWQVANESAAHGPGWAQEGVVLRAIGDRIAGGNGGRLDPRTQQAILNAWHDLFLEKKLAWGYDLDNPNSPFFHVR